MRSVAIAALTASTVACNAISGVGDLSFGVDGAGGGSQDASAISSSSSGSGTPEDCLDAVDDDLDGLVDCEDPDCAGFACAPTADAEYVVEVEATAACPPGTQTYDVQGCTCACEITAQAKCDLQWVDYSDSACTAVVSSGTASYNCFPSTTTYATHALVITTPGTCVATAAGTVARRLCIARSTGGGCGPGAVCVPKPDAAAATCVLGAADDACPPRYADATLVSDAATSCRCGCQVSDACSGGDTTYFAESDCTGAVAGIVPGDGTCSATSSFVSGKVAKPRARTTCNATASPSGGRLRSLCCTP